MPYLGEITMFACGFAPANWATANGQLLPIQQNTGLFGLIQTYYGGNGVSTFALPDLGGFSPMHWGQGNGLSARAIGETGGVTQVFLNYDEMAAHSHNPGAALPAASQSPTGEVWSSPGEVRPAPNFYASQMVNPQPMIPTLIGNAGGTLAHNNQMPYLAVTICIALAGETPPHG
jgi:microcystin-dependent protein